VGVLQSGYECALVEGTENVAAGDDPGPGQANGDWFPWFAHPHLHRRVVVGCGLHCGDVAEELVGCEYVIEKGAAYVIPAVVAENASDVGITGGGVVDGQGLGFVKRFDEKKNVMVSWNRTGACLGDECRPRLVGFLGCTNVRVGNVTLREPAYWWCVF